MMKIDICNGNVDGTDIVGSDNNDDDDDDDAADRNDIIILSIFNLVIINCDNIQC